MKQLLALLLLGIISKPVFSQAPPKPYGVLPTERQLKWQETEMYSIIHFSMATYADKEWGYGDEDPKTFNPSSFSAEQIISAVKAGGFKGVVVVAKHHDGFCLWPTATTGHNISKSPWKNGKGDIIKEYELACKKLGMKLGLYCSPWDRNSAVYGKPEYLTEVYRKQLKELYAKYGDLFMSWHDGANGGDGYYGGAREVRKIDRSTYYDWPNTWAITRKMQPGAAIFGDVGPDVRWVGNEQGHGGETCWETYTPHAPEEGRIPANGFVKDWEGTIGTRNGDYWMPAECDVPLRPGWFYHQSQDGQTKSAYALLDLYYQSVGRGACLDLGISPDKRGLITDEDSRTLAEFGKILRATFVVNLAKGTTLKASNVRANATDKFGPQKLLDNDRYSCWATDDGVTQPQLTINLHADKTFNVIRLRENIKLGQRIESFAVDAYQNGDWKEIATATSIGANRLIRLDKNITASKLRLRITGSPVCIALSDFGIFKEPIHLTAPVISRNKSGLVQISTEAPVSSIRYTLDGTEPTLASPVYEKSFNLLEGGIVKARSFDGKEAGEARTQILGISKANWKITASDGFLPKDTESAIDENTRTFYTSSTSKAVNGSLIVDMGKVEIIKAFTYLPRQDKQIAGIVDRYTYFISTDGNNWQEVAKGEFANIKSNPIEQTVKLGHPVSARYFKFSAEHVVAGTEFTIAELGVIK